MPTDEERREIARELREIKPAKAGHIEWWKIAQTLGIEEIDHCFGWEKFKRESVLSLADLIEPERITGETSDGYHSFNELYDHRAKLFSVIVAAFPDRSWKSKRHHDGTMYDGMFIVGIDTDEGQATYHYDIDPYGHTPSQAINRITKLAESIEHERTCGIRG